MNIEAWVSPAVLTWKIIEAYSFRLAESDQNAWLASRVFHDRVLNPRFSDIEQVREICLKFFGQMPATENGLELSLQFILDVFEHFQKKIEQQLEDIRRGLGPEPRRGQNPLLHTAESLPLRISKLCDRFGAANIAVLLEIFGLAREARNDRIFFVSEVGGPTVTEEYPLIVEHDHVYIGDFNALWLALYDRLLRASRKEPWSTRRGEYVEDKTADILRRLFGTDAVHQHVWEKKGGPEHDVIVVIDDALIVVEIKGAAAVPPITSDHRLNLQRIHAHAQTSQSPFNGIGQAQKLLRYLLTSPTPITLRVGSKEWKDGAPFELDRRKLKRYFAISVSLEEYGSLLTDWSLLKLIDTSLGNPWGVNLHAFEQFVWGIERRGWDWRDFLVYLEARLPCHGGMITGDELDYAGYWLDHGDLIPFSRHGVSFQAANWSKVFDDLWLERRGLGRVEFEPVPRPSGG